MADAFDLVIRAPRAVCDGAEAARTIGIARDPLEATGQLLASLHRHSYRRIGTLSAIGSLEVARVRVARHAENFVIVLLFRHGGHSP